MIANEFYVYRHLRLDSNTPFYIGKGKGRRAWSLNHRNYYHNNIRLKHGYEVEIVMDNLTEIQALKKEQEFIKLYKSFGYCEANLTSGGESPTLSIETRQKIRIANLGKKHGTYSKEHKLKISLSQKGKNKPKHSEEERLNKSKRQLGKKRKNFINYELKFPNKANSYSKSYMDIEGRIFINSEEASDFHKIAASTIRRWARLQLNGWKKIERKK